MRRDLELLNIRSVAQLAQKNPRRMYRDLCRLTGQKQDICCLDVFTAAVAQARNPQLPFEQCQWWYWSRKRKAAANTKTTANHRNEAAVLMRDRKSNYSRIAGVT
jgi:hypothetical protein